MENYLKKMISTTIGLYIQIYIFEQRFVIENQVYVCMYTFDCMNMNVRNISIFVCFKGVSPTCDFEKLIFFIAFY